MSEARGSMASTVCIAGHPLHAMIVPFPIVCFIGALVTDIAYARTAEMMWTNFSAWLLLAGVVCGAVAALFGLIDFLGSKGVRSHGIAWAHGLGNGVVWVLALFNCFVHSRDAWTSVMPEGLILSALTVLVLAVTAWLGASLVYRHGAGVAR